MKIIRKIRFSFQYEEKIKNKENMQFRIKLKAELTESGTDFKFVKKLDLLVL